MPTTMVSTLILLRVNSPMTLCMTPNSFLTMSEITCMLPPWLRMRFCIFVLGDPRPGHAPRGIVPRDSTPDPVNIYLSVLDDRL